MADVGGVSTTSVYVMAPSSNAVQEAIFNAAPAFARRSDLPDHLVAMVCVGRAAHQRQPHGGTKSGIGTIDARSHDNEAAASSVHWPRGGSPPRRPPVSTRLGERPARPRG